MRFRQSGILGLILFVVSTGGNDLSAAPPELDVLVYGGTPSGLCAAVAVAREGGRVMVIEPTPWIGGLVTGGLSHTDKGREETIGGIAREFFTRAAAKVPGTPMWFAEPHVNLQVFQEMLAEAEIPVLTGKRIVSLRKAPGQRIASVTLDDGRTIDARMFIDASYEGDVLPQAGVRFFIGRESRMTYGEPLAGFSPMPIRERSHEVMGSVCPCLGGNGPHYIHGTPCRISAYNALGQLISGVNAVKAEPGSGDKLTQSYNYRLCVTQRDDIRVPFPKPEHYDPERYELLLRLIQSYPRVRFGRLVHLGRIAGDKFDLNAQGLFSTDFPGGNVDYPGGDPATRERIQRDHIDYVQGLLWFLGHEERVPQALRDETNSWGLCRDEFIDHDYWPYALYVRDARRMVSDFVMTQRDVQQEIKKPDSVAMGSFVIDCHIVQRIVTEDGTVTDEGSFPDAPARPYEIPYRCLTPRESECSNLLVPVCVSASHIALCSMRMEPVYMALGQASGIAAMQSIRESCPVQRIDTLRLQNRLREQGQVLELKGMETLVSSKKLPGIVQDDADAILIGTWQDSSYGNPIDGAAQHDYNQEKGTKSATFTLPVPENGIYEVRFAYASAPNRAGNVPVTIHHARGVSKKTVDERRPPDIDKQFISLGEEEFQKSQPAIVVISTEGTDGFVSVDAVQLLPKKESSSPPVPVRSMKN